MEGMCHSSNVDTELVEGSPRCRNCMEALNNHE